MNLDIQVMSEEERTEIFHTLSSNQVFTLLKRKIWIKGKTNLPGASSLDRMFSISCCNSDR
jgi:hypothetical protein